MRKKITTTSLLMLLFLSLALVCTPFAQSALEQTLQNAQTGNANGTAQNVKGYTTITIQIIPASSWDGTVTFQSSTDGTNYLSVLCINRVTGGTATTYTSATTNAHFSCPVAGAKLFRTPTSNRTVGSVTVSAITVLGQSSPVSTTGGGSGDALTTNSLAQFAGTSSLELLGVITNETGTGLVVFNDTPTIITPTIASFTNAQHTHANAAGGGTITPLAFGLADPNADRILFWDDSAGVLTYLTIGSGLDITGTTLSSTASGGTVTSIATTLPIIGGTITGTGTISIADAGADGTTKGAATFTASDFNAASGLVSIDYANAATASASVKGFLLAADWTTFNNKVPSTFTISTTAPLGGGGDLSTNRTFTCTTCVTSAAALTANAVVLGGGSQAATVVGSLGTTTTVLHGNAAGAPAWGAVNLAADVTGNLNVTSLNSGALATNLTFWRGDGVWATPAGGGNISNTGTPLSGQLAQFTASTVIQGVDPTLASALFANQGTTITLLHGNALGNPTWAAVNLATEVTGNLHPNNLNGGTGATSLTFWRGDGQWASPAGSGTVTSSTAARAAYYTAATTVDGSTGLTFNATKILSQTPNVTAISGNTTLLGTPQANQGPVIRCTSGAGAVVATLPAASTTTVGWFKLIKEDVGAGTCAFAPNGTDKLNTVNANKTITAQLGELIATLVDTAGTNTHWYIESGVSIINLTTDVTGILPVANGGTGISSFGTGVATFLGTPSAANFAAMVTGETGTGAPVLDTAPTITNAVLVTPTISGTGFTNAQHAHAGATTGGQLTDAALSTAVTVAKGGTGLAAGTSGGIPYFSATSTIASSAALTANLPVIGGGAGVAPGVGTRSGNTTAYVTTTGAQTSGDCVKIDANGNHIANGSVCGGSGLSDGDKGDITVTASGATWTIDPVVRSIYISAGSMDFSGSCIPITSAALLASGPRLPAIGCTDNDADSIEFDWVMPDSWNASTITIELNAFSIGNNTTEVLAMDFAGQCVRSGDAPATHSTTGQQRATITWPATALVEMHATTAAITLNGTCAAGAHVYMRGQIDATATTMTPMTDLKILGVKVEYTRSGSD